VANAEDDRAAEAADPGAAISDRACQGDDPGLASVDLDTSAIEQRLRHVTPGPWRRHGCDVWSDGDPVTPLFTAGARDTSAERRQQADRDAEFVAHAVDDVRRLLEELRGIQ
jgi:hypothetical protein